MKTIKAVDLFCGAGGTSTGLALACEEIGAKLELIAIDHWNVAIETHSKNHPDAQHICESLDSVDPRKVVPDGHLHLLVASPECTHHSLARGEKPMSDQSRASGWHILRWVEALQIDNILIENVPEYESWGPLGENGRPIKSRRGETFRAFLDALHSLNYSVDYRILNAADYGDPTTRKRLFIMARRGRKPITWPAPTHSRDGGDAPQRWRAAREIIDWDIRGESIFTRKRPLAPATIERIEEGLRKFSGAKAEPFLVEYYGTGGVRSVNDPVATITTKDRFGLVEVDALDIRFRMLQPHELASAMSFPDGYEFAGTRDQKVKQIGNAVPCRIAQALCKELVA